MGKGFKGSVGRAGVLAALALAACEKPVPETPTFEKDVKPIFEAHCVRCHGGGGTLNFDPRTASPDTPASYLSQYQDFSDCTPLPNGNIPQTCIPGARFEAVGGTIKAYLHGPPQIHMPPAPAEPLSPWELAVVDNWVAESPPMP